MRCSALLCYANFECKRCDIDTQTFRRFIADFSIINKLTLASYEDLRHSILQLCTLSYLAFIHSDVNREDYTTSHSEVIKRK